MNKKFLIPYLLATLGIFLDWGVTTPIGLSMGFYEVHPNASPLNAFMIFYLLITVMMLFLRSDKKTKPYAWKIMSLWSLLTFIPCVNNTMVILGWKI